MLRAVELLDQPVAAALAEVVVHPDQRQRLGLELVADEVGDLRHADLLAERGAEQVGIAQRGQLAGFASDEVGNLGLLQHLHDDLDVAGEDRSEDHIRVAVDRLLHLRAGDTRVGLGVVLRQRDLLLEDAALGVELFDRQDDAVAEVAARHGDRAGYFAHIGELHIGGRRGARHQHQRRQGKRNLQPCHENPPLIVGTPFSGRTIFLGCFRESHAA